MKTTISGASDDLIEIEGAISDEHELYDQLDIKISCSDNTKGKIYYDNEGTWKIEISNKGSLFDKIVESVGDDDKHTDEDCVNCCSYSDVLILNEGIEWIKIGNKKFKI